MSNTVSALVPHLFFHGEARKVIARYTEALGATTNALMSWGELPGAEVAEADRDRVMHAQLSIGGSQLLIADRMASAPKDEHNGTIMIEVGDPAEMATRFDALAVGGQVTMPIHDAFWGAKFGILVDAFGVTWMFHSTVPAKAVQS